MLFRSSLGLFFGIPAFLEAPLSTMMWFAPDVTGWLVVNTIVALLVGGLRLALMAPTMRKTAALAAGFQRSSET